jgi:hypothetical protein
MLQRVGRFSFEYVAARQKIWMSEFSSDQKKKKKKKKKKMSDLHILKIIVA